MTANQAAVAAVLAEVAAAEAEEEVYVAATPTISLTLPIIIIPSPLPAALIVAGMPATVIHNLLSRCAPRAAVPTPAAAALAQTEEEEEAAGGAAPSNGLLTLIAALPGIPQPRLA